MNHLERSFANRHHKTMLCCNRPDWMDDTQWNQMCNYVWGLAVPTDPELLTGIRGFNHYANPILATQPSRFQSWAWYNVSASLLGNGPFEAWSSLIDNDYQVDEGL